MSQVQVSIGDRSLDISRLIDMLDLYDRDDLIEMLEDIAFSFAIHRLEVVHDGVMPVPADTERLHLLQHLISAIRAVKPI